MLSKLRGLDMNKAKTRERYLVEPPPGSMSKKRKGKDEISAGTQVGNDARGKKKMKLDLDHACLETRNYYEYLPKEYLQPALHYVNEPEIKLDLPMNFVITGRTGAGKTNFLMHLIAEVAAWPRIVFVIKERHEPFYAHFLDKVDKLQEHYDNRFVDVFSSITELPPVQVLLDFQTPCLVVYDDQITEKDNDQRKFIGNFFIMCRKRSNSCSVAMVQDYHSLDVIVRRNSQGFVFTALSSDRDIMEIMRTFSLGIDRDTLIKMFQYCVSDGMHVFFIDQKTRDPNLRFRKDLKPLPFPGTDPASHNSFFTKRSSNSYSEPKVTGAVKRKRQRLIEKVNAEEGREPMGGGSSMIGHAAPRPGGRLAPIASTIMSSIQKVPSRYATGIFAPLGKMINRTMVRARIPT